VFQQLREAIIAGQVPRARELTEQLLVARTSPQEVLDEGLIAAMEVVGDKFQKNEFFVPEVMIAARAMQAGMDVLRPRLTESGVKPIATVVIGTVKGDVHNIGKNLVGMMLEGAGFQVVDLGIDVAPEAFVRACQEHNSRIVAMSTLITTSMPQMKATIEQLRAAGFEERVKAMVGGAPVTAHFAESIGADGYGQNAGRAAGLAKTFLGLK
jgi:5-methyltetrahydrofolate--homocysteine methyltransferase